MLTSCRISLQLRSDGEGFDKEGIAPIIPYGYDKFYYRKHRNGVGEAHNLELTDQLSRIRSCG